MASNVITKKAWHLIIVGVILIFGVGIFGDTYIRHVLVLHNRFVPWEIASIIMSIFINMDFIFTNKAWQIPYRINGNEDKPIILSIPFIASIALLFFALILLILHDPILSLLNVLKISFPSDGLLLLRILLILVASSGFLYLDLRVHKEAKSASNKIKAICKNNSIEKKLKEKIGQRLDVAEAHVNNKLVEGFVGMLSDSFGKSVSFNDIPTVVGFSGVVLYVAAIVFNVFEKCDEVQLSIWISGASAFQLMASSIIFGIISIGVDLRTNQLLRENGGKR